MPNKFFATLIALTLTANFYTTSASATVTNGCGGLFQLNLFQVTQSVTTGAGQSHLEYLLVPLIRNNTPAEIWGLQFEFANLAGETSVIKYQSSPFLLPRNTNSFAIVVARSTVPFNAPYRTTPGAVSIANSAYYTQMSVPLCTRPHPLDMLFRTTAGRQYQIERSQNLSTWEQIETLVHDTMQPIVWRPHAWLKSPENYASEFYRINVDCTDAEDCATQAAALEASQRELKELYQLD